MRILVMSDLHVEFRADAGASFIESLDPTDIDVVALAGDIAVSREIPAALGLLCRHFRHAQVLFVHGNHEFYASNVSEVQELTRQVARRHRNLRWLETRTVKIQGRRFLGATLWFSRDEDSALNREYLNDFFQIQDFEPWVYEQNRRSVAWLRRVVRPGDVVITHHLPTPKAVAAQFDQNPLNPFFVCDVEDVIEKQRPALWIYGHTHGSADFWLGDTRLVCNPLGYVGAERNPHFDDHYVIEI
jgi:predicted phosphodiesterase